MITIRKSRDRGLSSHDWLDSRHTFSFAGYYDPDWVGFASLRVINDDHVAPGAGFSPHPHKNMEIISYVLEGDLRHEDSMGNRALIRAGEVQRISAGSGIVHSEYNASATQPVHFLQIWIEPNVLGGNPAYAQRRFDAAIKQGHLCPIVSPNGRDGSLSIQQDALLYAALLETGEHVEYALSPEHRAYVQVVRGKVNVDGAELSAGDGAGIRTETTVGITALAPSELLLFDLH